MSGKLAEAFWRNFLGHAPDWYKGLVIACRAANPLLLAPAGPVVTSWFMLFEYIVTLMMALRCYPLQPGGLIAIEATLLGLVTPAGIQQEIETGLPVILLLMFMVAGIFFLREMLVFTFTKLLVRVQSNTVLALLFVAVGALLSAFLDALTVLAVMITVAGGFYAVYHRVASGKAHHAPQHDASADGGIGDSHRADLEQFPLPLRDHDARRDRHDHRRCLHAGGRALMESFGIWSAVADLLGPSPQERPVDWTLRIKVIDSSYSTHDGAPFVAGLSGTMARPSMPLYP